MFHFEALIQEAGKDEKGIFIILDQTAFYPQGGGQPSDQGVIKNAHFEADVIHVAERNNEIRHYITSQAMEVPVGTKVDCRLDQERRLINARYHTAGQLLSNVVQKLYSNLITVKANHFQNESAIEFQRIDEQNSCNLTINVLKTIEDEINYYIKKSLMVKVTYEDPKQFYKNENYVGERTYDNFRIVQIESFPKVPCGGTHLSSIGEIGLIKINKIKNKNSILRISYEVQ